MVNTLETIDEELELILSKIISASSSTEFFDITCLISSYFEDIDDATTFSMITKLNLYVKIINEVFNNEHVFQSFAKLCTTPDQDELKGYIENEENMDCHILLNSALSCAFFIPALCVDMLTETNILFIRELLSRHIKTYQKRLDFKIDFLTICDLLEMSAWNLKFHHNQNFSAKYPVMLNDKVLFGNLKKSRSIVGISLLSLIINPLISARVKRVYSKLEQEKFSITVALTEIYGAVHKVDKGISKYISAMGSGTDKRAISKYYDCFVKNNEKNSMFFLKGITSNCQIQKEKKFYEVILDKVNDSPDLRNEYMAFAKTNLKAFHSELKPDDIEWSNKLFIISIKTISLLCELRSATDSKWIVKSSIFELKEWIINIHGVLNKYFIEDDWSELSIYLNNENSRIEWKSSFFTPLEQEFISSEAESSIGKKLFKKIVQTILGMLNTDGGTIIVGHIEHPHLVIRSDLNEHVMVKQGASFFDIGYELSYFKKTIDNVRLQILQDLINLTENTAEKFNDLVLLEPMSVSNGDTRITVVRIQVNKAEKMLTSIKRESDVVWASLTKRADGQTVSVDIRDYI
jgi:hypothetical protein